MTTSKSNLVEGATGLWEVVIGLEIHAQITSKSKLFSRASTAFGAEPNTQVSFVDAAMPGMLPVINEYCVAQAVKTGLGLNAEINKVSVFDRKNYFYADLPQGYQISQFTRPIVGKGYLDIELNDGTTRRIGVTRLHLEQDAGKSFHDQHPSKTFIDLNRSGIALMEIVSEPEMRSAEEAAAYVKKIRTLVRYLGTCDGNMEEGSLRADVNVSVRKPGDALGTRAEIKNVNSVRFLSQAIHYEVQRQIEVIESGGSVVQETRLYDANKGETRSMRGKENAHDYRYFPDPDLPPLVLTDELIARIKGEMPELPDTKRQRYMTDFGLSPYDASIIAAEKETAAYFDSCVAQAIKGGDSSKQGVYAKLMANWVMGEVFAALNRANLTVDLCPITPEALSQLIYLIDEGVISNKIAKDVFVDMWEKGQDPRDVVEAKGLRQVSDDGAILLVIQSIMDKDAEKVAEYRGGKDKLFGYFVGQTMKALSGKGNPTLINELLKKQLEG